MLCFSPFLLGVLVHRVLHGRKLAIFPGCCALLALRCQVLFCCTCAGLYCMQFFLFIGVVFARSATLFWGNFRIPDAAPGADGVAAASGAVWGAGVRDFRVGPRAVVVSCDARSKFEPFLPCMSHV